LLGEEGEDSEEDHSFATSGFSIQEGKKVERAKSSD